MRVIILCAGLLLGAVFGASAQNPTAARGLARWQRLTQPTPAWAAWDSAQNAASQLRGGASLVLPGRAVHHDWNSTTNSWEKSRIETYAYDSQGRLTQLAYADSATGVVEGRRLYTYDAGGLNTEQLYQDWTGTAWVDFGRYSVTYDAQRNPTEELSQRWTGTAWRTVALSRYVLTYNLAGVLAEQVVQRLDLDNGTFDNEYRLLYTISSSNQWTAVSSACRLAPPRTRWT